MSAPVEEAPHVHHPDADSSVEFKGYAAYEVKGDVKPFSYNPPKLSDEFVEVKISHCGICASDIHTIDSGWGPSNYPCIVGHEIVGTVTAAGKNVTHLKVGDRVGIGAQCGACFKCQECEAGFDQYCSSDENVNTYNSPYPDGQISQGGYADRIRCDGRFAFHIPEAISSEHAGPLMCAGITVFSPLTRYLTRPNMKVGIVGIGGLGHLGVKFAAKLQNGTCEVAAISHNSKKKEEALKMGAQKFIDTSDTQQVKDAYRTLDFILCTANGADQDYGKWLSMLRVQGIFCIVSAPEKPMLIRGTTFLVSQPVITGSGIGSVKEVKEMLAFAAEHNIRPIIQLWPMDKANEAIQTVRNNTVRFRAVLVNPSIHIRDVVTHKRMAVEQ